VSTVLRFSSRSSPFLSPNDSRGPQEAKRISFCLRRFPLYCSIQHLHSLSAFELRETTTQVSIHNSFAFIQFAHPSFLGRALCYMVLHAPLLRRACTSLISALASRLFSSTCVLQLRSGSTSGCRRPWTVIAVNLYPFVLHMSFGAILFSVSYFPDSPGSSVQAPARRPNATRQQAHTSVSQGLEPHHNKCRIQHGQEGAVDAQDPGSWPSHHQEGLFFFLPITRITLP
jgi:hypothetical protein